MPESEFDPSKPRVVEASATRMPNVLVLLLILAALLSLLTWLIPPGSFSPGEDGLVDLSSYEQADFNAGVRLFAGNPDTAAGESIGFLNFFFEGLVSGDRYGAAVGIMAFLLLIGGVFGIIQKSGAIDAGLAGLVDRIGHYPPLLLMILFVLFSLGGAVFGMGEEAIAFAVLLVPFLVRLGYPAVIGVLITYCATQVGFASSWMNPFSVVIAQGIAGLPPLSGAGYRLVLWFSMTAVAGLWVLWLAERYRRAPETSPCPAADAWFIEHGRAVEGRRWTGADMAILISVVLTMIWVIWGVIVQKYYLPEIAGQFFTLGLVVGIIARFFSPHRMDSNELADAFVEGASNLLPAALVVAMAKGMVLLLGGSDPTQASIMNTLLFFSASVVSGLPEMLSAWLMLVVQSCLNLLVTSGSGQAALTMPIMAPLGDLLGVTRQTSVLAFQLGDGLTNLIAPTSAALMGALGVARVDWLDWVRVVWPLLMLLFCLSSAFVLFAAWTGF